MARAVCSSGLLSAAAPVAPFLRTYRLGCVLVFNASAVSRGRSPGYCFPQPGPQLPSRFDSLPTHARTVLPAAFASGPFGFVLVRVRARYQHVRRRRPAKQHGRFVVVLQRQSRTIKHKPSKWRFCRHVALKNARASYPILLSLQKGPNGRVL
jgi:hypothetical protein